MGDSLKNTAFLSRRYAAGNPRPNSPVFLLVALFVASLFGLFVPAAAAPSFAPGFPGKKGPRFADEKHSFKPKLLLPPEGTLGVSGIPVRPDTVRMKLLAIRVDFPETQFTNPKLWVERHLLFASQYFYAASWGLLQVETAVTDTVFTMPKAMAHYGQLRRSYDHAVCVRRRGRAYA